MEHAGLTQDLQQKQIMCTGQWSISSLGDIRDIGYNIHLPTNINLRLNGSALSQLDSAGALVLVQCINSWEQQRAHVELINFTDQHLALLKLVTRHHESTKLSTPEPEVQGLLYKIGKESTDKLQQLQGLVQLVGDISHKIYGSFSNLRRFQFPSIISNMASTGLNALPIVGLLAFLIGVVLAYQMGLQLETYGATSFIAYLSGMAVFREFGPLITAIIVAGRTSSAFTAQIGSMKINEEIDALYTMGLSPTELLVVPKLIGLLIVFPMLIFWADFFGILGAMLMSKYMLHVGPIDFLIRLHDAVGFKQMMLGLYKAPTFAMLIAVVGCFQGFRVQANADSVGQQTTRSVVQALFLIIVTDAAYSVIYSRLNL